MRRLAPIVVLFGLLFALLSERAQQAGAIAGIGPIVLPPTATATPVTPPVPGYSLWLDATYASNTSHTWVDQSGNGYNAVASSSGGYIDPVLTPGAVNGLPSYLFPGGVNVVQMLTTGYMTQANMSVFAVFKSSSGGLASNQSSIDANYGSGYSMEYQNYAGYGAEYWYAGVDYLNGGTADTNPHIQSINMGQRTNGMQSYLDGLLLNKQTGGTITSMEARYIGAFTYSGVTWGGYISEILEYPVQLSPANTALTVEYLGNKWGVNVPPISLGPLFWYRSDKGVTSGGGNITQWNDQSGNGYTMTVDTGNGATAPSYSSSGGVNNLPYLTMASVSTQGMKNLSVPITNPMDVFVVAKTNTAAAASNNFLLASNYFAGYVEVYQQQSANTMVLTQNGGTSLLTVVPALNVPFIYEANPTGGGSSSAALGGGTPIVGNAGTGGTSTELNVGHVGNPYSGASNYSWSGDIYEVLGFNYTLTQNQRTNVLQYLQARYSPSDPGDLTDLVMWLRADQVVSPTNGAKFSQWKDLVNGGATYTQATSANQFVWNASDPNFGGRPSVTSTAASNLTTTVALPSQPFTIYAVINPTSTAGTSILVASTDDTHSGSTIEAGYTTTWYFFSPYTTGGTVSLAPAVATWVFNGASSAIYSNSSTSTVAAGTNSVTTTYPLTLGWVLGGADGLVGNAAEYLVFNGAHTPTQIARVYSYLAGRYGQAWN